MNEIELIIFDMDGLMFDTERQSFAWWKEAAASHGYEVDDVIYKRTIGSNARRTRDIYLQHFGEAFPYERVREELINVRSRAKETGVPVKDGLYELLDYLKKTKVKKAVATSTSRERALKLLAEAGVIDCFDYVLCGDEIQESKPHPEIFLKVAEKIGCQSEKCLVLEDSEAGILAAHAAGMLPIMVPDMKQPEEEIKALLYKQMLSLHEVRSFLEDVFLLVKARFN
ncbi:Phosphoglycolate phosphatase [Sporomusa silvacetica DSM 10669]|uniref:Phosphoglycolate phosphatase n=1 Tax=Sporomusa silvacetica DSM 10669 TaxID=1123289 RepID=A0ABZ3IH87_9FIRM|nr:HAD family phosphatase [Sporomusa silvacetica]OZC14882.1 phosphorylated carbohydrates phosphatase [Sporomusa silvacetica DSM 10669]